MRGLDPRIHRVANRMDRRVKPGDDRWRNRVAGTGIMGMRWRAALVSLLLFGLFVGAWHLATLGSGPAVSMDPEYAKLVGATASQGKSALPGPIDVGGKIWEHLKDPFYDRGSNDKGLGIQLAYSIRRVMTGFLLAGVGGIPLGFLIRMSPLTRRAPA